MSCGSAEKRIHYQKEWKRRGLYKTAETNIAGIAWSEGEHGKQNPCMHAKGGKFKYCLFTCSWE